MCCQHSWDLCYLVFLKEQVAVLYFLLVPKEKSSKKSPLLCTSSPYLYDREGTISLLSCLMMVLSVIITFLLWRLLHVICRVVISLKWVTLPDDTIAVMSFHLRLCMQAEVVIHSTLHLFVSSGNLGLVEGTHLLRARLLPDIQVDTCTLFLQEFLCRGCIHFV